MTTSNPDEAIIDIAVMDMNGGYYRTDYRKMMEKYSMQLNTMTDEILLAVEELPYEGAYALITAVEMYTKICSSR